MEPEILVRKATLGELEPMSRLAAHLVRMHHETDPMRFFLPDDVAGGYAWWFKREIERREAVLLVALQSASVVGYAYGTLEGRDWNALLDEHGEIHDLYVDASVRTRGVGRRLLDAIIGELEALGAPRITLSTMVGNENAQRLFRAAGFRPTMLEMTRDRAPRG